MMLQSKPIVNVSARSSKRAGAARVSMPSSSSVHGVASVSSGNAFAAPAPRNIRAFAAVDSRPSASAASAAGSEDLATVPSTAQGKLISRTEVAAFIQRDDMMDQMYRWAIIEAGEGGLRNFGMPMDVTPFYNTVNGDACMWGYKVAIYKEGEHRCDLGIMFDQQEVNKHEWVGRGDDGFPILEGKVDVVLGKNFEIWKLCTKTVDDELRSTIRGFCTGLVSAMNRYYAFGSVFCDDAQ